MEACLKTPEIQNPWEQFILYVKKHCSSIAFENWFAPIKLLEITSEEVTLEIPNVFVKDYLLSNYKKELCSFLPHSSQGEPTINFILTNAKEAKIPVKETSKKNLAPPSSNSPCNTSILNPSYTFESFIEGSSNQFVKSVALGIVSSPGKSYNPLFLHGSTGLGKTHLLQSIGHHLRQHNPHLNVQYITTEAFVSEFIQNLRNKTANTIKKFYRSLNVLLIDDIQFLEQSSSFEEELYQTFETLINQGKQVVITCNKSPKELKLSSRILGRMESGIVVRLTSPDLQTRAAIVQYKALQRKIKLSSKISLFIADHMYDNVRQLEGAVNCLSAHSLLLKQEITEGLVAHTLQDMFQASIQSHQKISIDTILKKVALEFNLKTSDLMSTSREKALVVPRQVAMYLAREMLNFPVTSVGKLFKKKHSTVLYASKIVKNKMKKDETLARQIDQLRRNIVHN